LLNQIAPGFSNLLGHPVTIKIVPRDTWQPLCKAQGMKNPRPRICKLAGFNEGWIEFESRETGSRTGKVTLERMPLYTLPRSSKEPR
jgi:hypothetical protein